MMAPRRIRDVRSRFFEPGKIMDVLGFLKLRAKIIRYYYENAAGPFNQIICKIQAQESPYKVPPYMGWDDSGEPPLSPLSNGLTHSSATRRRSKALGPRA